MVVRRSQMSHEQREKMRGGDGVIQITNLLESGKLPHGRLLAELTIPPGASIGVHAHGEETEYFIILSGQGLVADNGTDTMVSAGDLVSTGGGATHGIRNTTTEPLRLIALILSH
jgi:mannose-6-phosphate isomerase-like protein (cupin superfamily)